MPHVTLLPGDGIGPEAMTIARDAVAALKVDIAWDEQPAGLAAHESEGDYLPARTIESIRKNKLALKGPMRVPESEQSPNVRLRKELDLYANVRPIKSLPGLSCPFENVDFVVVRESTEDIYCGIEHQIADGVVQTVKVVTENASKRIARFAFDWARRHGRGKVTVIHKANIMKKSDGLFLACAREIAAENKDLEFGEMIVDATAMNMVRRPQQFDVMLCGNMYGDLLSDLGAGLVGGAGVCMGFNRGDDIIVYEIFHGAGAELVGKRTFNPISALRATARLIRRAGYRTECERLERAIEAATLEGKARTPDIGGTDSTDAMIEAIFAKL